MNVLSEAEAIAVLDGDGAIAQILGRSLREDVPSVAWITLRSGDSCGGRLSTEVRVHEAIDPRVCMARDPATFRWSAVADGLTPEGLLVARVANPREALGDVENLFGAGKDSFVELGDLPEAYLEFASKGWPARRGGGFWSQREPASDWLIARSRMEPYVDALFWQDLGIPRPDSDPYIEAILERIVRPEIEKLLRVVESTRKTNKR